MSPNRHRDQRSYGTQQRERWLPLPSDTRSVVTIDACENIGLWLDRYLTYEYRGENLELTKESKQRERVFNVSSKRLRNIIDALKSRRDALIGWYRNRGFNVKQFKAKPVWRFVVGLGSTHVLETGITLHRIFGLPIIPGSGLKGAARAYALYKLAEELGIPTVYSNNSEEMTPLQKLENLAVVIVTENDESKQRKTLESLLSDKRLPTESNIRGYDLKALKEKLLPFVEAFGCPEGAGKVIFLDAIPDDLPKFTLDVMNPHFSEYYSNEGKEAPSDWQSPVPVYFLTVSETPYLFTIAVHNHNTESLVNLAINWLKGALSQLGIGAKTSADYGYWKVIQG